jgi:hypothetical protein
MLPRDDPLLQGVRNFFWRHFDNGWMMDGQLLIWSGLTEKTMLIELAREHNLTTL